MLLNQLFVSYTRVNSTVVAATVAALRTRGTTVWHDESGIEDGDNIVRRLNQGLEQSRYVLLFASKEYFDRPWTRLEYEAAIYATVCDSSRRIFVVQLGEDASIPLLLAGLRRIPFTNAQEVAERLRRDMTGTEVNPSAILGQTNREGEPGVLAQKRLEWESMSELAILACASTIWSRRHELAAIKRSGVSLAVDIEKGAAINVELVPSLVANSLLMTRMSGDINIYHAAIKVAALYRAALTGSPMADVPTMIQADKSMERAQEALLNLRALCRDLSRSVSLITAV